MNDFVVVDEVLSEFQGEIIRGLLEAQGVRAAAFSQGGAGALGVSGIATVQIVVPAEQEAEALQILAAYYADELDDPGDEPYAG
jgi:hypothetical protein